jgi:hypothetical protein
MAMTCANCGARGNGKFCAQCGGVLSASVRCANCSNPIPSGGRFCNVCGTPVASAATTAVTQPVAATAGAGAGSKPNLPWVIAGIAVVALAAALILPRLGGESTPAATPPFAAAPGAGAMGDASSVDLSTMTPQEQATRLFNRVMESVSAGDSAQARAFAPMAVAAYSALEPRTMDDNYHYAMMNLINNDPEGTLAVTDAMLAEVPEHLYALFTAAQAHTLLGNPEEAADLYSRFVANYDEEMAAGRPEYQEHINVLPAMLEAAREQAAPS